MKEISHKIELPHGNGKFQCNDNTGYLGIPRNSSDHIFTSSALRGDGNNNLGLLLLVASIEGI